MIRPDISTLVSSDIVPEVLWFVLIQAQEPKTHGHLLLEGGVAGHGVVWPWGELNEASSPWTIVSVLLHADQTLQKQEIVACHTVPSVVTASRMV